jgi:RNA polymerase II subunit A-like phosphatase
MVVIIDDRADVWEWSPNLIKVVPCPFIRCLPTLSMVVLTCLLDDFFVGIGDINSTFLPKLEPLTAATSPRPAEAKEIQQQGVTDPQKLPLESHPTSPEAGIASTTTPLLTTIPVTSNEEAERAQMAANAMLKQNNLALEAQLEERPLAKKQEALQEGDAAAHEHTQHNAENKLVAGDQAKQQESSPHKHEKRTALLKNDDYELERVAKVSSYFTKVLHCLTVALRQLLDEVHGRFFTAYDARPLAGARRKSLAKREATQYDVKVGP